MKSIIPFALAAVVLCGCVHTQQYTLRLESEPPGAKVFMQSGAAKKKSARDFLGTTPCETTITGTKDGYFIAPEINYVSDYVAGNITFTFDPPAGATNLFSHSQTFRTPTSYVGGDKIPHALYFDMTKP